MDDWRQRVDAVWAAADDIPRGASIGEEMLRAVHFPTSALPAGTFADKAKLVGRVPRVVAPAGLPVLETMLAPAGTRPGVFVPPGMRAVARRGAGSAHPRAGQSTRRICRVAARCDAGLRDRSRMNVTLAGA